MTNSLQPYGLRASRLLCPRDSLDMNTGVGCLVLFQQVFQTQAGIEPSSLKSPALAWEFFTTNATWEGPAFFTFTKDSRHSHYFLF